MIPVKVDDSNATSALDLGVLICLRVGLGICRSLCIQVGVCIFVKVNFRRLIRHRYRLSDIAPESDDATGVAVIIALRARPTIFFLVGGFEEDFTTSVVWSGLEL